MTTKRQIIELAFDQIGMGKYAYDLTPEDYSSGLMRLNGLIAEWGLGGMATGFPMTDDPLAGEIDADSGLSAGVIRGVAASLAVDLAPSYGKQVAPDTQRAAQQGRRAAIAANFDPGQRKLDNMAVPAGAGYKSRIGIILPSEDTNEVLE